MVGVLVNTVAVLFGSIFGLLFKKIISQRVCNAVMLGLGLCVIYIGISGALEVDNILIVICAMVFGAISGTLLNIDKGLNHLGDTLSKKVRSAGSGNTVSEGFVTASLLFCVGAMSIVGSLSAGLSGDNTTLYTKSLLDMVSSAMLSATLGIGVIFSAAFILVYQGAIALLASTLQPLLSDAIIANITCAGSLLILALGFNMLGITKIKVADYLPAILFVPLIHAFLSLILKLYAAIA